MVRLSNPPAWTRANPEAGDNAPPDDLQDFVNYATAVATRYRGRISHYQVWNEPNIYPEWGNNPIDPAGYADMLCRAYAALKAVDPDIVVISGAIAPTIALDGSRDLSDLVFLQALYDHGGGDCFDVLSAQGYGLRSGPTDRRLRATSVNIGRHTYYRDIMVRNGDAHKPIWLSEAAWNATLDADLPPEADLAIRQLRQCDAGAGGALYMPMLYDRIQQEWQWVGNVMYWFFTRKDPFEADQAFYYFRMAEPDYQPDKPTFTPLPVYHSVRDYIQGTLSRRSIAARIKPKPGRLTAPDRKSPTRPPASAARKRFDAGLAFVARGTALDIRWRLGDDRGVRLARHSHTALGRLGAVRSCHLRRGTADRRRDHGLRPRYVDSAALLAGAGRRRGVCDPRRGFAGAGATVAMNTPSGLMRLSMTHASWRAPLLALILALLLLASALRFHRLGEQSLWYDEGVAYAHSLRTLPELIPLLQRNVHVPAYFTPAGLVAGLHRLVRVRPARVVGAFQRH